jgi:hypothetical protein
VARKLISTDFDATNIINHKTTQILYAAFKVNRPGYGISCYTEILLGERFQGKHLMLSSGKKADNYSENEPQPALSSST